MQKEYLYDTGSDLGRDQLDQLESMLDPFTRRFLEPVNLAPGMRCMDLGAGGGSVTRWLAEQIGPNGSVVAVDLDTGYLTEHPNIEVCRHDINDGPPPGGSFDVIHVRLLLMHLSRRAEILASLADQLTPGGWLVIGDFWCPPLRALASPSRAEEELFNRVQEVTRDVAIRGGTDAGWAHDIDGQMVEAGLTDVHSEEVSWTARGGDAASLLHRNYNLQLEPALLDAGLTEQELAGYRELMFDPCFRGWFYRFTYTRGQRFS